MTTYFDALGVSRTASAADVKKAYRKLAQKMHPDFGGNADTFKLLTAAYNALSTDAAIEAYARRVRLGMLDRPQKSWADEWNKLNGITQPKHTVTDESHSWTVDDLADYVRRTEWMRTEAKWQRERAERDAQEAYEREQAAHERAAREEQERYDRQRSAAGKCGAHTTSGPCCRPAGHTPNGHMSQKVADQKRANQKARKAAGK